MPRYAQLKITRTHRTSAAWGADGFWAITSYFNPVGYRRKLDNYRTFRDRLGVPLVTAELSFGREFELGVEDADVLIQLRGRDVLWQKERLLNVAAQWLPHSCDKIAWVDCDIVFGRLDWAATACRTLDDFPLIQLYRDRCDLPRDRLPEQVGSSAASFVARSVAFRLASAEVDRDILGKTRVVRQHGCSLGLGWAARREVLERHGIYDAGVLGGGDRALVSAAFGRFDALNEPWRVNEHQAEHFRAWAEPFFGDVRCKVGYIDGKIYHLWHGERHDRRYNQRYARFSEFGFNPSSDLALDPVGYWRWNSDKPEMHAFVRRYFELRNEDGRKTCT